MTTDLQGLHLHFDCASGIAGDMTLGALLDLGVPVEVVATALDQVGAGRRRLRVARCVRGQVAAVDVTVATDGHLDELVSGGHSHDHSHEHSHDHSHDHSHEHGHDHRHGYHHNHDHPTEPHSHLHVHYQQLRERIAGSSLATEVRELALAIFDRLARAEAKLHGTSVDAVAFHEVGAIDAVVDIVGTAAAWSYLRPASASCAQVAMGHGVLRCAHGLLPVPAPASLEILREAGGVMTDGRCDRELCTPTGAAILATLVTEWKPMPTGRALAIGWGAGDLELTDRPNVLRLTAIAPVGSAPKSRLAEGLSAGLAGLAEVWQIEANVDDMSPELCASALGAAFAAGALDVWWTPITMKKGRPALWLCALAEPEHRDAVMAAILRETTTIGVRCAPRWRRVLERELVTVTTAYGELVVKVARDGGAIANAAPELDDCVRAAAEHGVPVKEVMAEAMAAWRRAVRLA